MNVLTNAIATGLGFVAIGLMMFGCWALLDKVEQKFGHKAAMFCCLFIVGAAIGGLGTLMGIK